MCIEGGLEETRLGNSILAFRFGNHRKIVYELFEGKFCIHLIGISLV